MIIMLILLIHTNKKKEAYKEEASDLNETCRQLKEEVRTLNSSNSSLSDSLR